MDRYHEKNNQRRAELQARQFDELWSLEKKLNIRTQQEETLIQKQYGDAGDQLREKIDELKHKLEQKGIKGWWFRLRNGDESRHQIDMAGKSLENLEWRMNERREQYTFANLVDRDLLLEKHRRAREQLEHQISTPRKPVNKKELLTRTGDRQKQISHRHSMASSPQRRR